MRDYTQPHPNAIFRDMPCGFIEQFNDNSQTNGIWGIDKFYTIKLLELCVGCKTTALFIIKLKP